MKKIFFYTNIRTWDYTLGITRKVFSEIDSFKKLGYDVTYSGYLEDGVAIFNSDHEIIKKKKYIVKNEMINHIFRRTMIMNLCIDYLRNLPDVFDFSYARYHFFDRKYIQLLKALNRVSKKTVIEAHSTPKFQPGLNKFTYVAWKDKKWNKYAKEYVDLVASMSGDDMMWGIPAVKIANGIDVDTIRLHNYSQSDNDINLIAVSFESPVHGYDRVLNGIYNYYKNGGKRTINFHIVGSVMSSTRHLIDKLGLTDKCILYGPKSGKALDDIYDKANIGVGCLANHRIGSHFGSALKTKEYIAKGIPFIYGWKETILEDFKYSFSCELNDDPIEIDKVIVFYDSLYKEDLAQKIRSHLSFKDTWVYQMKMVVEAVDRLD